VDARPAVLNAGFASLPPPWSIDEYNDACFIARDANGQALAYVYFEEETGRRMGDAPAHARAETNIDAAMLSFQAVFVRLIEHLVGAHHQRHRDVDTECLCGCEINHQLELGRQGDRKVGGVGAF